MHVPLVNKHDSETGPQTPPHPSLPHCFPVQLRMQKEPLLLLLLLLLELLEELEELEEPPQDLSITRSPEDAQYIPGYTLEHCPIFVPSSQELALLI